MIPTTAVEVRDETRQEITCLCVMRSQRLAVFGHECINQLEHGVSLSLLLVLTQRVCIAEESFEHAHHPLVIPFAQLFQSK